MATYSFWHCIWHYAFGWWDEFIYTELKSALNGQFKINDAQHTWFFTFV